jgi:hypothetical protein
MAPGVDVLFFQHPDRHLNLAHELLLVAKIERADGALEPLLVALLEKTVFLDEAALLQRVVHPGPDLVHQHRLGEIVGGAVLKTLHRGGDLRHTGEHDEGHIGPPAVHLPEEGEAVHLGHVEIADDEGHFALVLQQDQRLPPIGGLERRESLGQEHLGESPPDLGIVVDQERAGGISRPHRGAAGRRGHGQQSMQAHGNLQ